MYMLSATQSCHQLEVRGPLLTTAQLPGTPNAAPWTPRLSAQMALSGSQRHCSPHMHELQRVKSRCLQEVLRLLMTKLHCAQKKY